MITSTLGAFNRLLETQSRQDIRVLVRTGRLPIGVGATPFTKICCLPALAFETFAARFPPGYFVRDHIWLCSISAGVGLISFVSLLSGFRIVKDACASLWSNLKYIVLAGSAVTCALLTQDAAVRLLPAAYIGSAWLELALAGTCSAPLLIPPLGSWQRWRALMLCYYGGGSSAWLWWASRYLATIERPQTQQDALVLRPISIALGLLSLHGAGMVFDFPIFSKVAALLWNVACWAMDVVVKPAAITLGKVAKRVLQGIGQTLEYVWTRILRPALNAAYSYIFCPTVDGARWVWSRAVVPAGAAIQTFSLSCFSWLWNSVAVPGARAVNNCVQRVYSLVASFFRWLWNSVVVPGARTANRGVQIASDFVASCVHWFWNAIAVPGARAANRGVQIASDFVASSVRCFWNSVAVPGARAANKVAQRVYDFVLSCDRFLWNSVVAPGARAANRAVQMASDFVTSCVRRLWNSVAVPAARVIGRTAQIAYNHGRPRGQMLWDRAICPVANAILAGLRRLTKCCLTALKMFWTFVGLPVLRVALHAVMPATSWMCAYSFLKLAQQQPWNWSFVACVGAMIAVSSVALMTTGTAFEIFGAFLSNRFGNISIRFGRLIQEIGVFVYLNLDIGVIQVVWQLGVALHGGVLGIAQALHGMIKIGEAVLSAVLWRLYSVLDAAILAVWSTLVAFGSTLWRLLRMIWESPLLSLVAVACTLFSAYQFHAGNWSLPWLDWIVAHVKTSVSEFARISLHVWVPAGVAASRIQLGKLLSLMQGLQELLAPVTRRTALELVDIVRIATSLTEHPWRILEKPSFAAVVALQHLVLSRASRWLGHATQDYKSAAVWLGRAGVKQVFGPLFIFGSLGTWCAESVLLVLQVLALPGLYSYLFTSLGAVYFEARQHMHIDRALRLVRAGRIAEHPGARVGGPRHGTDEAILQWLAEFPEANRTFEDQCVICMEEEYGQGGQGPLILPCGHQFHRDCVLSWFRRGELRCPLRCDFSNMGAARQRIFH